MYISFPDNHGHQKSPSPETATTTMATLKQQTDFQAQPDDTTSDIIVDKLIAWNVEVVFGLVGDGINPLMEAFRKKEDKIRFITVRHEEAAAFMASGYYKFSGKLGACIATTGPGAVHLLNGLYDAAMEDAAVIAITGSTYHDLAGTFYTQEIDTISLFKNIAVYNQQITGPTHAQTIVDIACRTALSTPGVTHITVPVDVQQMPLAKDKRSRKSGMLKGSSTYLPRIVVPDEQELDILASILNDGESVMILAGRGALNARAEIEQIAEKLGAPVAKALLGKAVLPDDSPYTTGGTGRLGTWPSQQLMKECDTLFIIGSTMPHLEYYPDPEKAKAVQIDRNPQKLGMRFPIDAGVSGDVRATLQALIPRLKDNSEKNFLKKAQQLMAEWKQCINKMEMQKTSPVKPPFLVAEVSKLLKEDALISIDTGAHTVFTARHLQITAQQQIAVCGNLASMAPGLPYAIAAQIAFPKSQSVAMVGDGSFTMLMGELATARMYNLPVKIIIFKNNSLAMDKFEQEEIGNKGFAIQLQPVDFAKVATAFGVEGYACSNSEELPSVLEKAFASTEPAVIEISVDPDEAPDPPEKIMKG
ncbi:thiamine pyrophosphate-binding protein [Danxiaibacter flavus]|uniref:Thiamine pyrophosphate-binding protein n=1 Tax=Danxiaibacter flavus TaxID=3049108 RepID=A0ABV3ZKX8_9BACT|nr:thiamine pyrophosphate-binding protein [Chitinophagaceae bacterium DXS]